MRNGYLLIQDNEYDTSNEMISAFVSWYYQQESLKEGDGIIVPRAILKGSNNPINVLNELSEKRKLIPELQLGDGFKDVKSTTEDV